MVLLKRKYNIFISKAPDGSQTAANTVKLLVEDFSFNRATSLTNVGRETLDSTQARTVAPHLSTIAPASFSLKTYILPLVDTNVTSPEEFLWTSLMGSDTIAGSPNSTPTSSTIDFSEGNVGSLQELTIWFEDSIYSSSKTSYRLDNAVIDSATIDFDINGIASITWEGRALNLRGDSSPPTLFTDRTTTTNYIKNRLSTLSFVSAFTYTMALTGGSIKIENNNEFYSRTQLGLVTQPVGHYTKNRIISGEITAYMKGIAVDEMARLYADLAISVDDLSYEEDFDTNISINLGGTTAPYIKINVPSCILELPQLQFDEIISATLPFTAKESTGNYCSIIYYAT